MKKEEMTVVDILFEAVGILAGIVYLGLQISYGISYGVNIVTLVLNMLIFVLVYVGLTLLQIYPERVNRLSTEVCVGKVRRYTITMVRFIKLIFILCLLLTSVCDVMGYQMEPAYSLIVVGVILLDTFYFEIKIIRIIKEQNKDK